MVEGGEKKKKHQKELNVLWNSNEALIDSDLISIFSVFIALSFVSNRGSRRNGIINLQVVSEMDTCLPTLTGCPRF
ncbi:hypothetical protein CEXT_32631 [Caerostris extrusa]|uniref:Uncharacterized protein n=1 Tax=Caerostris extrusa TaxID=172846 RepID=A0AAV4SK76_CAEEX|nr:hypothetical protein CEXT_32631 [Caerostris extrusa]